MASAKLANSTVNHSHSATRPAKTFSLAVDDPRSRKNRMVVRTEPTSTTNMTGLRTIVRGFSLTKLSLMAWRVIAGSNRFRVAEGRRRDLGGLGGVTVGSGVSVVDIRGPRGSGARRWGRARGRARRSGRRR